MQLLTAIRRRRANVTFWKPLLVVWPEIDLLMGQETMLLTTIVDHALVLEQDLALEEVTPVEVEAVLALLHLQLLVLAHSLARNFWTVLDLVILIASVEEVARILMTA